MKRNRLIIAIQTNPIPAPALPVVDLGYNTTLTNIEAMNGALMMHYRFNMEAV